MILFGVPRAKGDFLMTVRNGKPCKKCGTSDWYKGGACKECARVRTNQWYQAHPAKNADRHRRWYQANSDKVAKRTSRWHRENPDKANAKTHRRRTRQTEAGGSYTAAEFKELCDHYGNKCLRCWRDDVKLTPDHIRPVSRGGSSNIENIQPLCGKCNSAKRDRHIDYRPDAGPLRWLQCKLFG